MPERLQKFLARAGVASRRRAEQLIAAGRVNVNGETVTKLGTQIDPNQDRITIDGQRVAPSAKRSYFLFYKPAGVVTTLFDPQGRPTAGDYTRTLGVRVFPVGRLDFDAEGALLLTDDGALANQLMHPRFQVERVYLVQVKGIPSEQALERLRAGVRLEDGVATARSAQVRASAGKNSWLSIVVSEGRSHLIKRMCAAVGHPVVRLFRPSHAGIGLEGLQPGRIRALDESEIESLRCVAAGEAPMEKTPSLPPPRRPPPPTSGNKKRSLSRRAAAGSMRRRRH